MSALVEKIEAFTQKFPIIQNGKKLTTEQAQYSIWTCFADSKIGIQKNDPQTHQLLNPDFISEKDFRTVFCDEHHIALPCVRALMKEVMGNEPEKAEEKPGIISAVVDMIKANKPIGQYKTKELLDEYNADSNNDIWNELRSRAKGQPCIIFNKDGGVNVALSFEILKAIRKGDTFGSIYNDGEKTYAVYPVGVFPDETVLCCPITGNILNNGFSRDLGISWNGIDEDALVFIRVIRDENKETIGKLMAKQLLKTAKSGGLEALKEEYQVEALAYDKLDALKKLPSLRVNRNSLAEGRRIERGVLDPFGSPKRS